MITENLSTLKIHKLTQEQYDREVAAGNIDETAIYLTPDKGVDLSDYVTSDTLSNMLLISGGTNFAVGDNLDDFNTPGVYISGSTGSTTNLDHDTNPGNVPVTTGFKMFVIGGYINSRVDQFITTNSNAIWHRKYNGSKWSTWERFYTTDYPPIPACTTDNNGQFLRVVNGKVAWATVNSAEGVGF